MSWLSEYLNPGLVIFIGAVIAGIGGFLAYKQQTKYQEERVEYERQLRAKSDEVAELNRTSAATVTGGDSFCYLAFSLGDGATNKPPLVLVHQGEYPLYDLGIRIVDLEKYDLLKGDLT